MSNELAYFAGLIDGEGCITIKRTSPRGAQRSFTYVFSLAIEMCDPRPIKALCDFFDLTMTHNTSRHRKNPEKHRYLFVAQIGRQKGIEILKAILPYLRSKREEAELAIEFYESSYPPHRVVGRNRFPVPPALTLIRHDYYLRLRDLKSRQFEEYQKQSS